MNKKILFVGASALLLSACTTTNPTPESVAPSIDAGNAVLSQEEEASLPSNGPAIATQAQVTDRLASFDPTVLASNGKLGAKVENAKFEFSFSMPDATQLDPTLQSLSGSLKLNNANVSLGLENLWENDANAVAGSLDVSTDFSLTKQVVALTEESDSATLTQSDSTGTKNLEAHAYLDQSKLYLDLSDPDIVTAVNSVLAVVDGGETSSFEIDPNKVYFSAPEEMLAALSDPTSFGIPGMVPTVPGEAESLDAESLGYEFLTYGETGFGVRYSADSISPEEAEGLLSSMTGEDSAASFDDPSFTVRSFSSYAYYDGAKAAAGADIDFDFAFTLTETVEASYGEESSGAESIEPVTLSVPVSGSFVLKFDAETVSGDQVSVSHLTSAEKANYVESEPPTQVPAEDDSEESLN